MKVGSLFSGIGGMDLGLERAGMEIVWQVEIDEWCRRVLARHFPNAVRYGDVRGCHGTMANTSRGRCEDRAEGRVLAEGSGSSCTAGSSQTKGLARSGCLAAVDLICGGFPCQPVSHAGRRLGAEDSRWLWPEFARIIREVRSEWVLVENVPGLLSIEDGRLFGGVLRDLAESGYDAEWNIVSAADMGAPHLRERVFVVAVRDDASQSQEAQGALGERANTESPRTSGALDDTLRGGLITGAGRAKAQPNRYQPPNRVFTERGLDGLTDGWWAVEPNVGRVAHGIPSRVDRLRGLGNAVVPQVAEYIGRLIMETQ